MLGAMIRRRRKRLLAPFVPVFVSAVHGIAGNLNYPGAFLPGDWATLVCVGTAGSMAPPTGWTDGTALLWFSSAYDLVHYSRFIGVETSVIVPGNSGLLLIYRGPQQIGTTNGNSGVETTDAATTITVPGIAPSSIYNRLVAVACDRDPSSPILTSGTWTSRVNGNSTLWGMRAVDKATGVLTTSDSPSFNQSTTNPFRSAGFMFELRP